MAILQRLLVVNPFSRLTLSVQLFSEDAADWWDNCGPASAETSATAKGKRPSVKTIAANMQRLELEKGYPAVQWPDVRHIPAVKQYSGVDGNRPLRNTGNGAYAGPIEVDDGVWTDAYLAKWDAAVPDNIEGEASCSICSEAVKTSVSRSSRRVSTQTYRPAQNHLNLAFCHSEPHCTAITHLFCLSQRFLSQEASIASLPLVPDHGTCPNCQTEQRWGDIIRGCYRRHQHVEDSGAARALRAKRILRIAKLKEKNGGLLPLPGQGDADADEGDLKAKKPATGKKKKAAKNASSTPPTSDSEVAVKTNKSKAGKKPAKVKGRSPTSSSDSEPETTKQKAGKKSAKSKGSRSSSGSDSEASLSKRRDRGKGKERATAGAAKKVRRPRSPGTAPANAEASGGDSDSDGSLPSISSPKKKRSRSRKNVLSELSDDDIMTAMLSDADEAAQVPGSGGDSSEASDEERNLAYAAAADGSMEMAAFDIESLDDEDSDDSLSEPIVSKAPAQAKAAIHARKISDSSVTTSPAGKRKKVTTLSSSSDEATSPVKRVRKPPSPKPKQKKVIEIFEISD